MFLYNLLDLKHTIVFDFETDGPGLGKGKTGVLSVDGVAFRYDVPFEFTGTINKLTFKLGPTQLAAEDRKQLSAIADRVARAVG